MSVSIEASARLHLGFYNFLEDGVAYGGLSVTIEEPKVVVKVRSSDSLRVENRSRVYLDDVVHRVTTILNVSKVSIEIVRAIPRHVGLGSATQSTLAIGYAISKLFNMNYTLRELALKLSRGRNSGIGIVVFEKGGLL